MPDLIAARALAELLNQSPFLLAVAGGALFALKGLPRARLPCLLLLAGAALMLVTVVGTVVGHNELVWAALREQWPQDEALRAQFALNLGSSCLRALAVGLYLAAALARRPYPAALLRQWWSGEPDELPGAGGAAGRGGA